MKSDDDITASYMNSATFIIDKLCTVIELN